MPSFEVRTFIDKFLRILARAIWKINIFFENSNFKGIVFSIEGTKAQPPNSGFEDPPTWTIFLSILSAKTGGVYGDFLTKLVKIELQVITATSVL